jgi:transcriptional regulator with GAF, ATPase, and Fis domain
LNGERVARHPRVAVPLGCKVRIGEATFAIVSASGRTPAVPPVAVKEGATVAPVAGPRGGLLIVDASMQAACDLATRLAAAPLNVLLRGETGVGKEHFAALIHEASPRSKKPFLQINCAALPESLLEAELFGFEKGAFTGATQAKEGLFEAADSGTLFLDETGDMPLTVQAKLLRVLESGDVRRIGSTRQVRVDVRVVSATHRNLHLMAERGEFRSDLLFRLNGATVAIPPLRERKSDILPLADFFLQKAAERTLRVRPTLGADAAQKLVDHHWPGNVRELRNVIERAFALALGSVIGADDLVFDSASPLSARGSSREPSMPDVLETTMQLRVPSPTEISGVGPPPSSATSVARMAAASGGDGADRERILAALDECAGNQTRAAKLLGMSRFTLMNRLEAYGIKRPRKKATEV